MFNFICFQILEQFEIYAFLFINFWFFNVIITNFLLYSLLIILSIFFFYKMFIICCNVFLVQNFQSLIEASYKFILDILDQQVGRVSKNFFVLMFTVFSFILISNLIGLTPYSFTTTSHILQTFTLSFSIFFGLTIFGFIFQNINFLQLFVPKGVPSLLLPFLVLIEFILYFSRTFSLAIRLFANMMSGHTLLNILSGFGVSLFTKTNLFEKILAFGPFLIVLVVLVLEFCIAFLQAYVFVVLLCIYLNDSYNAGGH